MKNPAHENQICQICNKEFDSKLFYPAELIRTPLAKFIKLKMPE